MYHRIIMMDMDMLMLIEEGKMNAWKEKIICIE